MKNALHLSVALLAISMVFLSPLAATAKEPPAKTFVKAKCALCHGRDGHADTPAAKQSGAKDFRLPDVQAKSDEELRSTIAEGRGKMPGFGAHLDDEQIRLLVSYVRELGSK